MGNFASPEWVNVKCNDSMLDNTLCTVQRPTLLQSEHVAYTREDNNICPETHVKHNTKCVLIRWENTTSYNGDTHEHFQMRHISQIRFVTNTVKLSPIISAGQCFKYHGFYNKHVASPASNSTCTSGFAMYGRSVFQRKQGRDVFKCDNNVLISPLLACDGADNCDDSSLTKSFVLAQKVREIIKLDKNHA